MDNLDEKISSYGEFVAFLYEKTNEIFQSKTTFEDVIEEVESEIEHLPPGSETAALRILLGKWLNAQGLPHYAIEKFVISAQVSESLNNEDSTELLYSALIEQACLLCFIDSREALTILKRAIDLIFTFHNKSGTSNTDSSPFEKARIIRPQIDGFYANFYLGRACIAYAICLSDLQHSAVDLMRWFQIALECLSTLDKTHPETVSFHNECLKNFFMLLMSEEGGLTLSDEELASFPDMDRLMDDVLFSDPSWMEDHVNNVFQNADPIYALDEIRKAIYQNSSLEKESKNDPDSMFFKYVSAIQGILDNLNPDEQVLEYGLSLMLLGILDTYEGEFETARDRLERSYKYFVSRLEPGHLYRYQASEKLSEIFLKTEGNYYAAANWAVVSMTEATFGGMKVEQATGQLRTLAEVSLKLENPSAACLFVKLSIIGLSSIFDVPKGSHEMLSMFTNINSPIFEGFVKDIADVIVKSGRIGEAFHFLSLNRETALRPKITDSATREFSGDVVLTKYEEKSINEIYKKLENRANTFQRQFLRISAVLRRTAKKLKRFESLNIQQVESVSKDLIKRHWQEFPDDTRDSASVHYTLKKNSIDIFVLTESDVVHEKVVIDQEEFQNLVFFFLKNLLEVSDSAFGDHRLYGHELYKLLIAPIENRLKAIKRLIISPTGILRFIPLNALYDGSSYLIERFTLVNLPDTGTDLKSSPLFPRSLALAGGSFSDAEWLKLPAVNEELDSILQIAGAKNIPAGGILDKRDQEFDSEALAKILGGTFEIVHIATHFQVDPANIENSTLMLGDYSGVRLGDIEQLPSGQIQLIVLSACNTGIVDSQTMEIDGRSFRAILHKLGARAVVSTLWPLYDSTSPAVIKGFYQRLLGSPAQGKAEALREAQLVLLRQNDQFSHPYFWASFTISGNWLPFSG